MLLFEHIITQNLSHDYFQVTFEESAWTGGAKSVLAPSIVENGERQTSSQEMCH